LLRLSLWLRGFRATQRSLQALRGSGVARLPEALADREAEQVCRMVLAAGRHSLLQSTCLERSLTLWWLLARRGISSQLRIGARKTGGRFAAHAWVERNGEALCEAAESHLHYAAFEREFGGDLS